MEIMEIILLIAGGVIFILSFFIPERKTEGSAQSKELAKEEIASLVSEEMEKVRSHVDDVVDEAVNYAMEKTERSLERLSNEKIMAVSEYSDTVLADIHKNHEEAMFLYDMLNSKHVNLKNTVSEVNKTVKEAEEAVTGLQKLTPQAQEIQEIQEKATEPEKPKSRKNTKKVDTEPESPAGRVSFLPETDEEGHNNNQKILELHNQGKSNVVIARELGLGVGEVKLVIDLFQNQQK
ncbi:MAG: DUF6115 domain-containing protein [Acetatifactor sp.]